MYYLVDNSSLVLLSLHHYNLATGDALNLSKHINMRSCFKAFIKMKLKTGHQLD